MEGQTIFMIGKLTNVKMSAASNYSIKEIKSMYSA